jgi:CDP-diglyceride synthetase
MIISMPTEKKQGLSQRLVPATLGFTLMAFAISQVAEPQGYGIVCFFILMLATGIAFELHGLLSYLNIGMHSRWRTWAACTLPAFFVWNTNGSESGWFLAVILGLVWPMARAISRMQPLSSWMGIFFSFFYVGLPLGLLQMDVLPKTPHEAFQMKGQILLFLASIKGMDVGGYFVGRYLGKRKLAPAISPKKTWEGFLAGLALSALLAFTIAFAGLGYTFQSSGCIAFVGAIWAVCSQAGDLFESYLKRLANVKDSGRLPGVGGVLDMMDSILPSIYVFHAFRMMGWL